MIMHKFHSMKFFDFPAKSLHNEEKLQFDKGETPCL